MIKDFSFAPVRLNTIFTFVGWKYLCWCWVSIVGCVVHEFISIANIFMLGVYIAIDVTYMRFKALQIGDHKDWS